MEFPVKKMCDVLGVSTSGYYHWKKELNLADRMVVGWNLSDNMTDEDTVIAAFKKALYNRKIDDGLIFHSDRGSQYVSDEFRKLLANNNCIQSMSRKGNCWDYAVAESFFKTIETEFLNRYKFTNINQVYSNHL